MAAGAWETVTIYALCDPSTASVRYVGKAVDLDARLRTHRCESKNEKRQDHKSRWMRSINCNPMVKVLEVVPYEEWADAERRWIAVMKSAGCELTNFADGGQTSPMEGKGHSEETKDHLRKSAIARGCRPPSRKGTSPSLETRAKQSATNKAIGKTPPPVGGWNKGHRKTHCRNGHEYSASNTRVVVRPDRVYQQCRTCAKRQMKAYKSRKAAGE